VIGAFDQVSRFQFALSVLHEPVDISAGEVLSAGHDIHGVRVLEEFRFDIQGGEALEESLAQRYLAPAEIDRDLALGGGSIKLLLGEPIEHFLGQVAAP